MARNNLAFNPKNEEAKWQNVPISFLATKLQSNKYVKVGDFLKAQDVGEDKKLGLRKFLACFYEEGELFRADEGFKKEVIEKLLDVRWAGKTIEEVIEEVAQEVKSPEKEATLEGKALNAKQLEGLLRDLDDHLVEQGKQSEAVEKLLTKYQIKDEIGKKLVREAIGRKIEIQRQLESELIKKGVTVTEAKRIADAGSDAAAMARKRLSNEVGSEVKLEIIEEAVARAVCETEVSRDTLISRTNSEVKRIIGDQAIDIEAQITGAVEDAVAEVTIKTQLGDNPKVTAVAIENERVLRPILGAEAAEITLAALAGDKWEEEVARIVPDKTQRDKVEKEIAYSKAVAQVIEENHQRAEALANQMAEILEIKEPGKIEELAKLWEERIEAREKGDISRLGEDQKLEPKIAQIGQKTSTETVMSSWVEGVEEISGKPITDNQAHKMGPVIAAREVELNNLVGLMPNNLRAWENFETKNEAAQSLALANPGASEEQINNGAEVIANINHPKTDLRAGDDTPFWVQLNQINQEGEITPQRAAEIGVIRNILVSNQPVDQWLDEFNQKTEGLRMDQITDDHVAAANNVRNILGQNPDMVKFMESTRLKAAMSHSVQAWMGQRIAGVGQRLGIQSLQNFGLKLSNSAGFSLNFAKDAAGVLSKTGFGMEGIKGVLGLVGGQGAGGLVTGIAAKLGLGATGVGLLVVGAQIGGAIIGKLFSPVTNFIRDKLGIDLGGLTNIGGSIASGLGLKAALPGLVAKLGAALPAVGSAIAGFGASVLGAISTAGATILAGPLIPIVIVGVIVGIPLIMMLTTNNQAATMVPPGRGVGGPVFDTATLPGGWLAPPPISVDPALLKDSCPQGFPMGGTITQGPNAPTCSHVGYENTIDIAGNLAAVTATHQGIVTTAGWTDSGYGNYVDIAGKCIRKDANNNPIEEVTFVTRYAHLESIGVAQNEEVLAGQTIGISDNTGNSTGPHVHYEVRGITWKLDDFNKYDRCCIGSAISCPN